jgi:hypothetical protein
MNVTQKIIIVVMDVLLLLELCISMYLAHPQPDAFTAVFVKSFLMMCVPTLIVTKILVSRLRSKTTEAQA